MRVANNKSKKAQTTRRINVELAPGIQFLVKQYLDSYNNSNDRTSPPIRYTDLINTALDAYLTQVLAQPK
jgi:hypothetical protein